MAIDEFFLTNLGSVPTMCLIWETFKLYIRGITISKHAGVLKPIRTRLQHVEATLKILEGRQQATEDPQILAQIRTLITEFNELAEDEVKYLGKYATARTYAEGDRPSSTLEAMVRPHRGDSPISCMHNKMDELVDTTPAILEAFADYYQGLYMTRGAANTESDDDYLTHITMIRLTNSDRERLIGPLRPTEIIAALKDIPSGKAPGVDGLMVAFLRHFRTN